MAKSYLGIVAPFSTVQNVEIQSDHCVLAAWSHKIMFLCNKTLQHCQLCVEGNIFSPQLHVFSTYSYTAVRWHTKNYAHFFVFLHFQMPNPHPNSLLMFRQENVYG